MNERTRVCQRAGCQRSATVTLAFRYDARQASLTDLSAEKDPSQYDLCVVHADLLNVPRGWERLDRRTLRTVEPQIDAFARRDVFVRSTDAPAGVSARASAGAPARAPAAASAGRVSTRAPAHPSRCVDRYAVLLADLPRLAAAYARGSQPHAVSPRAERPARAARPTAVHADRRGAEDRRVEQRVVDDLPGPYRPVSSAVTEEPVAELEGQLQMAIEPEPDGVVVALTRARHNSAVHP